MKTKIKTKNKEMDKKIEKKIADARRDEFNWMVGKDDAFYEFQKNFQIKDPHDRLIFYRLQIRELTHAMELAQSQLDLKKEK